MPKLICYTNKCKCDLRQKKFSYWFKNLNPTTCCLHDMTTEENDSERFQKFKGKEGL